MPLPDLAVTADLTARGIDTSNTTLVNTMLAVASATVRSGAGRTPISLVTSTVKLTGRRSEQYLQLPGPPVRTVTSVKINGTTVTDWRLDNQALWRDHDWGVDHGPAEVEVTYSHGLTEVPAHIVDLVCSLAAAGITAASAAGGYMAADPRLIAERIGDYSVTYAKGAEAVASAMDLPRATRQWLKRQFGGGVGLVTHR